MKPLVAPSALAAALLMLTAASPLVAQSSARLGPTESGIYLSADDYLAGKLAYAVYTRTARHVIDRHALLNKSYVDVEHDGQRVRLEKAKVFGFRDAKGRDVRFVGSQEYGIAEAGPLYIYTRDRVVPDGKRVKTVTEYSFSRTATSPVIPLTKENVKRALPNDHQFHHVLDMSFPGDAPLAAYDSVARSFKLSALYRQSQ